MSVLKITSKFVVNRIQDQTLGKSGPQLSARLCQPDACIISVTAGELHIIELAQQLAWLSTVLLPLYDKTSVVRFPCIADISVQSSNTNASENVTTTTCRISCEDRKSTMSMNKNGSCWEPLFDNAVVIGGYPILRRDQPGSGLELSLGTMAYLTGSDLIARHGDRVYLKSFNMLLVATLVTTGMVIWHLLANAYSDERISYFHERLDALDLSRGKIASLRDLETTRHFIGWCPDAEDICGSSCPQAGILRRMQY